MRLDWNDIRARAAKFADEWKDAHYERGESQTFYNEFFELFGVTRRRVASFEHGVNLPENKRGFLDLFWKGKLLIEQKSRGRDLIPARQQALDYFPGLKEHELPRYILLSDFQNFELYDLDLAPDTPVKFQLSELPDHVQAFGFIVGQEKRIFRDQDPANIQASEMMGALHDALEESGYKDHALERFLVRLLFCLFADDTGIFQPLGIFEDYVKNTREDGADVGPALGQLFQVLNSPDSGRHTTLSAELAQFPYINGDLFQESLPLPSFNRDMREKLLNVCGFRWEIISPAIFGSLFQSVMDKEERRKKGGHYTSERNILKVIEPLFMDELKAEFAALKARRDTGRKKALETFHDRLSNLTFFDPACGCGNFLVIAYRELRDLEIAVLTERFGGHKAVLDVAVLSTVNVDRFYGIEIEEFPARIAEVAMWMTDHIMNVKLSAAFGKSYLRIPLTTSPNIRHADALEIDWAAVLPPEKCSYVFGNPPFIGAKFQSEKQRAQVIRIAALGGSGGSLDYVCAWFIKAGEYLRRSNAKIAFVATNSITQGEQVAQLWPLLFDRYKLEIAFAHRTFQWLSDARGMAHVHCVIIGLVQREHEPKEKRLYSYNEIDGDPVESGHAALSPYLFDASRLQDRHLVIIETTKNLSHVSPMVFGNMPNDGGYLILTSEERNAFVAEYPALSKFVRRLIGADDLISGTERYCLWLVDAGPEIIRNNVFIRERVRLTAEYRRKSRRAATQRLAETSYLFGEIRQTGGPFAIIPRHSSETRQYVPIGFQHDGEIAHDSCLFKPDADLWDFGLVTSRMHMAWLRNIGGRLKSDYRYSIGIVYNPFPWPDADEKARAKIKALAQAVLDARSNHPGSTLADLYDPDVMPPDLRKAHRELDAAVDRLYRNEPFASDRERVEHLFALYEKLSAPMLAAAAPDKRRAKQRRIS
jgi:hypothetical protein